MKKLSTYYFLLLALANAYMGWLIVFWFNQQMLQTMKTFNALLPKPTVWCLEHPWWPWVFSGLFGIGFVVSLTTKISSAVLCHPIIVLLVIEGFVLFVAMLAYGLPLLPMTPCLMSGE